jgi:hypothetical protein
VTLSLVWARSGGVDGFERMVECEELHALPTGPVCTLRWYRAVLSQNASWRVLAAQLPIHIITAAR